MLDIKRGPGRPRRDSVRDDARPERRRKQGHTGFGRQKLNHNEIRGFGTYWSKPEELEARIAEDWDHVTWDEVGGRAQVGDVSITQEQQPGEFVNRRVGTTQQGSPLIHYLLKKRTEHIEEDEKKRTESNMEPLNQIHGQGSYQSDQAHGTGVKVSRGT